ncbi:MAG TPA: aldehyde dehydrogenase family protein [Stackebrandtia sp.]|jgi:acyl-CoA reductase-like NAD-dependent aldehyde dehydrogenase|uniref:aldehyde dehydrogenase family protein n=1 Tax=Stackebrandtia sp. TaxID=2023065 RepID=UPI002D508258|nr:aldehyde dehydrogenase family protein [Stackebrandtia sp.]HZE40402.1 aldehyde dehydrogenase family protein [Stackebrandtia sp.]
MNTATAPTIDEGFLVSTHPGTGAEVGRHAVADERAVNTAVAEARELQKWWANLGFAGRRRLLLACRAEMARRVRELVAVIRAETGKSVSDAFTEIATSFEHLKWAPKHARRVLGPRRVPTPLDLMDHASYLEYRPYGVVAVIGPWNYPLHTPMGSIIYALAAGNTVVFKPSEYTPSVGQWIADVIADVVGRPIVTVVHGLGDVGGMLCSADVDKIAFTGSVATAKKVAKAAAERLTPVLIEGGGKDAAIVDADANLDTAADYVVWAAFTNAGQSCTGIERAYVVESVAEEFIKRVVAGAAAIRVGDGDDAHIGPITMPRQVDVIARHIQAAVDGGAEVALGGPEAVRPPYVDPTILVDVPEDNPAVTEETFGPVLVINRVRDADEALRRTNALGYGLGGAVFARRSAVRLARGMLSGMTSINSGFAFAAVPSLPFGGVGDSGYGRAHGADGLREFAFAKAIAKRRLPQVIPLMSMKRKDVHNRIIEKIVTLGVRKR